MTISIKILTKINRKLAAPLATSMLSAALLLPNIGVSAQNQDILKAGDYIPNLVQERYTQPFVVQALTDRSYFVANGTHNATFYVSDKGVMVFDPLSFGSGAAVIKAVKSVTDLPITALVYSHYHLDHLADAHIFVKNAQKEGVKLDIIAPQAVSDQITRYGNQIPVATTTVSADKGFFEFDGLKVNVIPANDTHSLDNTMFLLEGEKVLHYPDAIEPEDFIPYFRLVGALDIAPLITNLEQVKSLDWEYLNAGHGNVGSRKDIDKHLVLIQDIKNAVNIAFSQEPFEKFFTPNADILVTIKKFHNAVAENALASLKQKYGQYERFNVTMKSHVDLMITNLSYYQMPHQE